MAQLWPARPAYISPMPQRAFIEKKTRSLALLGSTGSIGQNALSVVEQCPHQFHILALAGGRNVDLLARQALRHRPPFLGVLNEELALRLRKLLPSCYRPAILAGPAGYARLGALDEADCVLSAQVGAAGLPGTLAAALAGKVIALANKEALVLAGAMLRKICDRSGASILPVDSEHNAIFQCLAGRSGEAQSLILTASGGPFRGKSRDFLAHVRAGDALKHPNWNMGTKISIDSATMMNKGLEIIEAVRLYGFPPHAVRALVHPQSIVHSLVTLRDNSLLAQMAVPDMRLPIAACLLWPHCGRGFIRPLDLVALGQLSFEEIDVKTFPALALAREALIFEADGHWRDWGLDPACIVLNGANEAAVELFLRDKCGFNQIAELVGAALEKLVFKNKPEAPPYPELEGLDPAGRALALASGIDSLDQRARLEISHVADLA